MKYVSIKVNDIGLAEWERKKIRLAEAEIVNNIFDMRPYFNDKILKLRLPIYKETASYGHMGRKPQTVLKSFCLSNGNKIEMELFTCEKLDFVEKIKSHFANYFKK